MKLIRYTRSLPSVEGRVRAQRVEHPLGAALRLDYVRHYAKGPRIATVQFFVNSGEIGYVITYATRPRLMKRYAEQFAASARTLRQVDPA